ncbi:Diphthamide biosynthesis protein [Trachipleistophora hominis]|uniref:2-(3-amino-3-carboxypropyl)histidine synthase subunit 1 n=1 Tax=Trachipleistophora hominis TaxID=72359 RepID=L7K0K7_TRAHO|nr:Diphthamide biosynthesis protein [Trachipleistophora hominis]
MVKLSKHDQPYNLTHPLSHLPPNYNFELKKVLSTITRHKIRKVGLQLPDGLLKYSTILSDAIESNTGARVITLADVVYGACCVDTDADVELIVHYGHSCIVGSGGMKVLYVFVDVFFESDHLERMVRRMIDDDCGGRRGCGKDGESRGCGKDRESCRDGESRKCCKDGESRGCGKDGECRGCGKNNNSNNNNSNNDNSNINNANLTNDNLTNANLNNPPNITVLGTVQYRHIVYKLNKMFNLPSYQVKPLSTGEVLGCTSPKLKTTTVIFISDGRFHLESLMIANPTAQFYRYCPFNKRMYREHYDHERMYAVRAQQRGAFLRAQRVGIINGTLGAQGNSRIVRNVHDALVRMGKEVYVFNMEEVKESNLRFAFVEGYVQVCCPRLSIDWGHLYGTFMLCAYEVFNEKIQAMDFYSKEEVQPWNNH